MKKMKFHGSVLLFALVALAIVIQGCSSTGLRELANPTPIHKTTPMPDPVDSSSLDHKAIGAAYELPIRYYAAFEAAKAAGATQTQIDTYVSVGAAVVEVYCVRWFGRVADAQRNLQFGDSNRNVITQLGTALIGVAKLHSDVTAVYGAANTALAGLNSNINSAFLIAPNAENVKRLVLQAIGARVGLLKSTTSEIYPRNFDSAYLQLEKLADLCTYAEVKKLATQAVDQSNAKANSKGEVFVVSAATRAQATTLKDRVDNLLDRVDKLTAPQALALSNVAPFRNNKEIASVVAARDPKKARLTDEKAARAIAKMMIILTANAEDSVAEWESTFSRFDQ